MSVSVSGYADFIKSASSEWTSGISGAYEQLSRSGLSQAERYAIAADLLYERAQIARGIADNLWTQARTTGDAIAEQFWSERSRAISDWADRRTIQGNLRVRPV